MRKKVFGIVAKILLMVCFLSGCGTNQQETDGDTTTESGGNVTIYVENSESTLSGEYIYSDIHYEFDEEGTPISYIDQGEDFQKPSLHFCVYGDYQFWKVVVETMNEISILDADAAKVKKQQLLDAVLSEGQKEILLGGKYEYGNWDFLVYIIESSGNIVQMRDPFKKDEFRVFQYSDDGKMIQESEYEKTREVVSQTYEYDEKGLLTRSHQYRDKYGDNTICEYQYNDDGTQYVCSIYTYLEKNGSDSAEIQEYRSEDTSGEVTVDEQGNVVVVDNGSIKVCYTYKAIEVPEERVKELVNLYEFFDLQYRIVE